MMHAEIEPSVPLVVADDGELRNVVLTALAHGTPVWIRATGSSMEPTIPAGSLIRVQGARGTIHRGAIVLALPIDGVASVHRVRRVDRGMVVTIGDNRLVEDRDVPVTAIAGIVDAVRVADGILPLRHGSLALWQVEFRRLVRRIKARVFRGLR